MGKLKSNIKRLVKDLDNFYYYCVIKKAEHIKIKAKKNCWEQIKLTEDQIREIEKYYGQGVDTRWHRYYQYFTGKFDAAYVPEILYSTVMESKMNPRKTAREMEDKSRLPILYGSVPGIRIPKTVVLNASGVYYDGKGNILTKESAEVTIRQYLQQHGQAILKPIRDTSSGKGVEVLREDSFRELKPGMNFIVQERIINQEDIRKLNPNSLNTMRLMTYICDEQYCCAPVLLRMGGGVSHLDNAHAGGVFIGVKNDGALCAQAYSEYGEKHDVHPYTKVRFEGYRIQNVEKVIRIALECHKQTPHMRMVSWDFTLDDQGNPVLIETNLFGQSIWLAQIAHGESVFGENTARMLEIYK